MPDHLDAGVDIVDGPHRDHLVVLDPLGEFCEQAVAVRDEPWPCRREGQAETKAIEHGIDEEWAPQEERKSNITAWKPETEFLKRYEQTRHKTVHT